MPVTVVDRWMAGMRCSTLRGPRQEVFAALGEHFRAEIGQAVHALPEWPALDRYARTDEGLVRLSRVSALTRTRLPGEYAELAALAEGAALSERTLLLVNLRGDLPPPATGAGCSDLGLRGRVLGHNEDGGIGLAGGLVLLTLDLTDDVPVLALWYPGFLPSNAFVVNAHGLVFGVDHLPLREPGFGPGRHFAARAAQRSATLDEAVAALCALPSAGGFAYNLAELGSGRIAHVEAAAGQHAVAEDELLWHTNHLRGLSLPEAVSSSSRERAKVLEGLVPPPEAGVDWVLDVLTSRHPRGVFRDGEAGESATLCSCAVDLAAHELTLVPRGGERLTLSLRRWPPEPRSATPAGPGRPAAGR
ncbi:hypothetical protein JOF53_002434 [Crossiella equi]|uniref:Peptidase C45 hydrolase domain-containing protein n=1 Tax=Crossiella equi TaxID=130796 RepID=A0ABS5ABA0_9PSEU|nr:C45 family peptidase [Crossiella equi]MBP2473562.1 hypothetical protein [Crossiella equi]